MNWLDWILAIIVALSAWRGLRTGLIAGMARILGLVLGLAAAFAGYVPLARYADRQWHWGDSIASFLMERFPRLLLDHAPVGTDPGSPLNRAGEEYLREQLVTGHLSTAAREMAGSILELLSFIALALAVYILVIIVMHAISGAAKHSFLSPLDRLGGLVLGLARGVLVTIIVAGVLTPLYSNGTMAPEGDAGLLGRAVAGSVILPYAQAVLELLKLQFPGWPPFTNPANYIRNV